MTSLNPAERPLPGTSATSLTIGRESNRPPPGPHGARAPPRSLPLAFRYERHVDHQVILQGALPHRKGARLRRPGPAAVGVRQH